MTWIHSLNNYFKWDSQSFHWWSHSRHWLCHCDFTKSWLFVYAITESMMVLFSFPCSSFKPQFKFLSWSAIGSWIGPYEKDYVNCENSKTAGQLPLYVHFKSVAFCSVGFSLLKMHEPTVQVRLLSPRSTTCLKNSWKGVFIPHCYVKKDERSCVNQCSPDPVSPGPTQVGPCACVIVIQLVYNLGTRQFFIYPM